MWFKKYMWPTIILIPFLIYSCSGQLSRNKRHLIFPAASKIQFIMGFGIPVALQDMSVTIGTVFKCTYQLPVNSTQVTSHSPIVTFARDNDKVNRWDVYKMITNALESFGYSGKACLLKSICDVAAIPFHDGGAEIIHELLHIIFTPSTTSDQIREYSDTEYLAAEELGKTIKESCNHYFSDCKMDVLDMFTKIKAVF